MAPPSTKKARKTKESKPTRSPAITTMAEKRAHNTAAPISKLHPDILAKIFTIVASRNNFSPRPPMPPPYRWIQVTHVCRSWRKIALRSPQVWGYIRATKNIDCAKEMLLRSGSTPLYLYFGDYRLDPEFLDLALDNTHRTRSIDASLSCTLAKRWNEFSSGMPQLTDLSLRGSPGELVMLRDLIKVLRGTPNLERLHLEHALEPQVKGLRNSAAAELAHLQSLHLTDKLASCLHLLRWIEFPQPAEIFLECLEVDQDGAKALGERIGAQIYVDYNESPDEDEKEAGSLGITQYSQKTRIQAFPAINVRVSRLRRADNAKPWVDIILHGDTLSRYGQVLCAELPLSTVRTLFIKTKHPSTDLPALVKGMSTIRLLAIEPTYEGYSAKIPDFLSAQTIPNSTMPSKRFIFPSLPMLEIFNVAFRSAEFPFDDRVLSQYLAMLSARAAAGRKIRRVTLHFPTNILRDDIRKLEAVVGEVVWDPENAHYTSPLLNSEMEGGVEHYMENLVDEDFEPNDYHDVDVDEECLPFFGWQ